MAIATGQPHPLSERELTALQRRYHLAENPVWTAFHRHRSFCESFGLFVLLAPELAAVELARRTVHDETLAAGGAWHHFFITPDTAPGTAARWLLALPPLTPESTVWISASIQFTGGDGPALLTTVWRAQAAILNMQRDLLRARITCPLILAGPAGMDSVLRESSPDLWSVRESVVHLHPAPLAAASAPASPLSASLTIATYPEDQGDPDLTLSEAQRLTHKPGQTLLRADLLRRAGDQFLTRQQWEQAARCLHEAWTLQEQHHALPETLARTAHGLGVLYLEWGNYPEARTWLERHRAIVAAAYPPDAPEVLTSLNDLAILLHAQGDLAGAEPLYHRALEARERTLGPEHPDTLSSLNNLANLLTDQGDLAGAEPLYRRALEAQERTLGPEDPDMLSSLNNLAILLKTQGDHAGAEPLYRRALEAQERTLGPEHPDTLTSLNNLAKVLSDQGDLAGAEPLYRRALEARERTLGPEHPDTLSSLNNLGALRKDQGRLEDAEALYARAVAGAQALLLPQHPWRLQMERNLARVREALRQQRGQ